MQTKAKVSAIKVQTLGKIVAVNSNLACTSLFTEEQNKDALGDTFSEFQAKAAMVLESRHLNSSKF